MLASFVHEEYPLLLSPPLSAREYSEAAKLLDKLKSVMPVPWSVKELIAKL